MEAGSLIARATVHALPRETDGRKARRQRVYVALAITLKCFSSRMERPAVQLDDHLLAREQSELGEPSRSPVPGGAHDDIGELSMAN